MMVASGGERSGGLEVVVLFLLLATASCSASGASARGDCALLLRRARISRHSCGTAAGDCCQLARNLFSRNGGFQPCTCFTDDKAWSFTIFLWEDETQEWLSDCKMPVKSILDSCMIKGKNLTSVAALRQGTLAMSGGLQGYLTNTRSPGAIGLLKEEKNSHDHCSDRVPVNGLSCAYQKAIGKCSTAWMAAGGFCKKTCGIGECSPLVMKQDGSTAGDDCAASTDIPPDPKYSCSQQKEWGKCNSDFMVGGNYCAKTCGRSRCPKAGTSAPLLSGLTSGVADVANKTIEIDLPSDSKLCIESPYCNLHNKVAIASIPAPSQLPGYMPSTASISSCVPLLDGAMKSSDLKFLGEVMKASRMDEFLSDSSLVATAILPTDSALVEFYESLEITKDIFLADVGLLQQVIKKHFVPNVAIEAKQIAGKKFSLMSLSGEYLYFDTKDEQILTSAAADGTTVRGRLIAGDLQSCGSIVHVVDTVLIV